MKTYCIFIRNKATYLNNYSVDTYIYSDEYRGFERINTGHIRQILPDGGGSSN